MTDQNQLLREALEIAIRQNEHDMLMTGEELRFARAALAALPPEGGEVDRLVASIKSDAAHAAYMAEIDHEDARNIALDRLALSVDALAALTKLAQPAEGGEPCRAAWVKEAIDLATDFGVTSLRVGSCERLDGIQSPGMASFKAVELRKAREAARERLVQHLHTTPPASPVVAEGGEAVGLAVAADHIDALAEAYLCDQAMREHDTGDLVFACGEAGRDYHSTLVELADEIRGLYTTPPASQEPKRCQTCGTHEVSLALTCHNSACSSYAEPVTVYEGWKQSASHSQAQQTSGLSEACATISRLLHHAATWDQDASVIYVQWPEHLMKEVALKWAEVIGQAGERLHALRRRKSRSEEWRDALTVNLMRYGGRLTKTQIRALICWAYDGLEPNPELFEGAGQAQQPSGEVVREPTVWVPTRQMDQRETTTRGYLWFSNPQSAAWTPLYTRPVATKPEPMTCHCETCRPITPTDMRMVLCPKCGNKRCPHATDHRNACTNSNAPGQPGSAYANCGITKGQS